MMEDRAIERIREQRRGICFHMQCYSQLPSSSNFNGSRIPFLKRGKKVFHAQYMRFSTTRGYNNAFFGQYHHINSVHIPLLQGHYKFLFIVLSQNLEFKAKVGVREEKVLVFKGHSSEHDLNSNASLFRKISKDHMIYFKTMRKILFLYVYEYVCGL